MKRTDQYLYLANGRLHRSLFGAINEKGEVKMRENGRNLGGALAELVNNFGLRRRAKLC